MKRKMVSKKINPTEAFFQERKKRAASQKNNQRLQKTKADFMREIVKADYIFNFSWLGRPIIQHPQDLIAIQEIVWNLKPDFIIDTGIAHGGSLIFYASLLELNGKGKVIGIDNDLRPHNRREIKKHRLFKRIKIFDGSSTDEKIVNRIKAFIGRAKKVLVMLDSNHTHEHVLKELELYGPLVSVGSYCIVCDTAVETIADKIPIKGRPWGKGNNPKTAVDHFLKINKKFKTDEEIENRLLITSAPGGYLRRIT